MDRIAPEPRPRGVRAHAPEEARRRLERQRKVQQVFYRRAAPPGVFYVRRLELEVRFEWTVRDLKVPRRRALRVTRTEPAEALPRTDGQAVVRRRHIRGGRRRRERSGQELRQHADGIPSELDLVQGVRR